MAELFFNAAGLLYGGTSITEIQGFISQILDALTTVFTDASIKQIIDIFLGIGVSLLTVFLYVDILDKATKDMITLEKLIMIFIKYFLAIMILINLPDLIVTLFNLAKGLYDMLGEKASSNSLNIEYYPGHNLNTAVYPEWSEDLQKAFKEAGIKNGISALWKNFLALITTILVILVMWVGKIAGYFIVAGNALSLIARVLFAPLGVVQCFDEGLRSSGIRYLKKIVADALTFAVILGIMYAMSRIQVAILGGTGKIERITPDNVLSLLSIKYCIGAIVLQLSAVGAMMKASQIANDVVGC